MKIIVTGGGTAGHVTPLLAVASKIKKHSPNTEIRYIGKKFDGHLSELVKSEPSINKSYSVFAGKLRRFHGKSWWWYLTQPKLVLQNLRDLFYLALGIFESAVIMLIWRPDVVFVKGGFVGLPVGLAASFLRVPIVTHDSDTLPGLTNRILSKYATKIAVGQPVELYKNYPASKLEYCGVPLKDFYNNPCSKEESRLKLGINQNSEIIAVVGGSLGAVRLNNAVLANIKQIMGDNRILLWLTGHSHFTEIDNEIKAQGLIGRVVVEPYSTHAEHILNASDLVVSRAGATFLAELSALQKPTILVPNPLLTGGHQTKNAEAYLAKNASVVVHESDIKKKPKLLADRIVEVIEDKKALKSLSENIKAFYVPDATDRLADLIINVGSRE